MRRIIQLLNIPDSSDAQGCLVALCNDGSIWYMQSGEWTKEPAGIPQDEPRKSSNVCSEGNKFPCNPACDEFGCLR